MAVRSSTCSRGAGVVLAYPIEKHRDGFYAVAKLKLEPEVTAPLERSLSLNESVIRHLLVRMDEA